MFDERGLGLLDIDGVGGRGSDDILWAHVQQNERIVRWSPRRAPHRHVSGPRPAPARSRSLSRPRTRAPAPHRQDTRHPLNSTVPRAPLPPCVALMNIPAS
ncbi:hypothetical protein GCM10010446_11000 [Streptomyces enissocaesilis]|uniref:Uncharacterized protein n=1 Tax=Streptomyces enissocaesilis TaxID=332589 RepID=A0ABN3WWQ0_9ACTN